MITDAFWRYAAVPLTMVVVAAGHTAQFIYCDRSSWGSGCGLGMFATVDFHGTRSLRCRLVAQGECWPAVVDRRFARESLIVRILADAPRLNALAKRLAQQPWRLLRYRTAAGETPHTVAVCEVESWLTQNPGCEILSATPLQADHVELELWGLELDLEQRRISVYPKLAAQASAPKRGE